MRDKAYETEGESSHETDSNDSSRSPLFDRRRVLSAIGATGAAFAGIGAFAGTAAAWERLDVNFRDCSEAWIIVDEEDLNYQKYGREEPLSVTAVVETAEGDVECRSVEVTEESTTAVPGTEELPTDPGTEAPTDPDTEESTDPETEESTGPDTEESPTAPDTDEPTDPDAEEPTDPETEESPTAPGTDEPTDPDTEEPTDPDTEEPTTAPPGQYEDALIVQFRVDEDEKILTVISYNHNDNALCYFENENWCAQTMEVANWRDAECADDLLEYDPNRFNVSCSERRDANL